MNIADKVLAELEKYAAPGDAEFLGRFFKTGKGQYGEGDVFIGVRVPKTRIVAKLFKDLSIEELETLLEHPIHEVRLCAVIIMADEAGRADEQRCKMLYDLYLKRTDRINNWDIVDTSCRDVVGGYLLKHPEEMDVLKKLARSKNLWERRIAMVSTWQFIRVKKFGPTFEIAGMLLGDKEDLMHKAVGWMLREVEKRDAAPVRAFLEKHAHHMPRTALRYAIEHFDTDERQYFMQLR
jgi:3-methyladenine DNA glycosylase AlkD